MKMNETFLLSKNNRNKIYFSCIILKRFFSLELAIFVNNYLKEGRCKLEEHRRRFSTILEGRRSRKYANHGRTKPNLQIETAENFNFLLRTKQK